MALGVSGDKCAADFNTQLLSLLLEHEQQETMSAFDEEGGDLDASVDFSAL